MANLILLRHGKSTWNLEKRFTGWTDVPLAPSGEDEARMAGHKLKDHTINRVFTSILHRATQTTILLLKAAGKLDTPIEIVPHSFSERRYGDLEGRTHAEVIAEYGEEQVWLWRRSYDVRPPNGESLADTASRVKLYFDFEVLPELRLGKNILIVAHNNSLRGLVMHIEGIPPELIGQLEIPTGIPWLYSMENGVLSAKRQVL